MLKRRQLSFLSLSLLLALLVAAVMPFAAFAQDETPQPADPPVVEEVPPAEDLTVPEVLEQLPADTTLVVLDQSGEALPLTAEEAAAVVVTGDPIWCPSGVDPNPGEGGCTGAQPSFMQLIKVLQSKKDGGFDYAGAGTIYIAWDYNASTKASPDIGTDIIFIAPTKASPDTKASTDYGTDIIFDLDELGLTDLVVQGGWGGAAGSSSNLSGINSLNFWYSGETPLSLTLNNIVLDGAGWNGPTPDGSALDVSGYGNVELNNVSVTDSYEDGAYIYADGDVTIKDSDFSGNGHVETYSDSGDGWSETGQYGVGDGLHVKTVGNVTLNNVSASENYEDGAYVRTYGTVAITDSQFNSNGTSGFWEYSSGTGYIYSNWDTGVGAYLSGNALTLTNVTASDNLLDGVVLADGRRKEGFNIAFKIGAVPAEGSVMATITCSTFEDNGGYGVYSKLRGGTLTLNGVTFNGNTEGGYYHEGTVNVGPCQPVTEDGSDKKGQTSEPLYILIEQLQSQLPGTLGNGLTFGSAFKVELTGTGEKVQGLEITLSFPIPDGMKDAKLGVMFWNGSAWVEVPGGGVVDGKFVITVTTPGLYVLVSK